VSREAQREITFGDPAGGSLEPDEPQVVLVSVLEIRFAFSHNIRSSV
jgi:hypothetical protein